MRVFLIFIFCALACFYGNAQYTTMTAKGYEFKYTKHDSGLATPYRDTGTIVWGTERPGLLRTNPNDSVMYYWTGLKWSALAKSEDIPVYTSSNGITKTGFNFKWGGNLIENTTIDAKAYDFRIDSLNSLNFFAYGEAVNAGDPYKVNSGFALSTDESQGAIMSSTFLEGVQGQYQSYINSAPFSAGITARSLLTSKTAFSYLDTSHLYINADSAIYMPSIATGDSSRQLATTKWVKQNLYNGLITASNGLTKSVNDIQLGGALIKPTDISATNYEFNINDTSEFGTHRFSMQTNGNALIIGKNVNGVDSTALRMSTEDNETMLISYYNGNVYRLFVNSGEATMAALNADLKGTAFHFMPNSAQFIDTRDTKTGLEYAGDYSTNYTNRSLVDKEYVVTGLADKLNISDTAAMLSPYLLKNALITGATKTKITYDAKGLVTAGADATTDDIIEGSNLYFTEERAQDATGSMVDATLVYNDGLPSLGRAAIDGDITISAGSNTAAITADVIVDADINTNAAINVTKLAAMTADRVVVSDGSGFISPSSVTATTLGYLDATSSIQNQLNNKVTKGGDTDGTALLVGTNDNNSVYIETNNVIALTVTGDRDVGVRKTDPKATVHLFGAGGNGAGSAVFFGDTFGNTTTPYVSIGENGGTDSDALEGYGQKGIFFRTGTAGSTARLAIQQDGDVIIGSETQVAGAELTVVGDADVSGNLNVQGDLTSGNILRASAALNFPSTVATAVSTLTINVPGADVGDPVFLGVPNGSVTTTATYWAWVSAANTVSVRFSPKATEDPASGTFTVTVFD